MSPRHSLRMLRRTFSVANKCLPVIYLDSAFLNRQFILPSKKYVACRRKRDWFCIVFWFFFNQFWLSEPFHFEVRGEFKQRLFIFPPLTQTSLSALCFFASPSEVSLDFCLLSCPLFLFGELLCSWGLNNISSNSANVDFLMGKAVLGMFWGGFRQLKQ